MSFWAKCTTTSFSGVTCPAKEKHSSPVSSDLFLDTWQYFFEHVAPVFVYLGLTKDKIISTLPIGNKRYSRAHSDFGQTDHFSSVDTQLRFQTVSEIRTKMFGFWRCPKSGRSHLGHKARLFYIKRNYDPFLTKMTKLSQCL